MFTKPLLIVAGVSLVLIGLLGFLLKQSYAANGALETQLAAADTIIKQREADAKANAIAVAQLAQKLTDTETKVITVTEKIYAAPVTRECAQSPAMRAARGSMRTILSGGEAGDSAKPPPAVPGPAARP